MSPPLREATAQEIVNIIDSQGRRASFSAIMVEAKRRGALAWHMTLRRYLDLLVQGGVIVEEKRDVGSVNPQQLYRLTHDRPTVYAGPKILEFHGLNWDTSPRDVYPITTDLVGLMRSKPAIIRARPLLAASKEDSIAHEIRREADRTTGTLELVTAMAATQNLDLAYLLRRSDELEVGKTVRRLLQRLIQIFTGIPQDGDGRIVLASRERFLQLLRQYSKQKALDLLDTPGKGSRGIRSVNNLAQAQILNATGKQLGITG